LFCVLQAIGICALQLVCAPVGSLVGTASAAAGECGSGAASLHAALGAVFGVALLVLALYANGVAYARLPSHQACEILRLLLSAETHICVAFSSSSFFVG
jgi:hypothetical protein